MLLLAAITLVLLGAVKLTPHPYLTPLYQVRHLALGTAFPLLGVALWQGDRTAAVLAGVAALTWCMDYYRRLRPAKRAGHTTPAEGTIRCLSLNVGDHRSNATKIMAYLREADCDVACLQEVQQSQMDLFDEELTDVYPFRTYHGDGIDGLATLSKYPLGDRELLRFEGRLPHLLAHVLVAGRPIRVINAHPFVTVALVGERSSAAVDIKELARVASEGPPTVMMGDFNTTDQTRAYRRMVDAGLVDAFRAATGTFGATFPIPMRFMWMPCPPIVRIDFHWHTQHFAAVSSRVGRDASSDHLPLETVLAWMPVALEDATEPQVTQEPRSLVAEANAVEETKEAASARR